MTAANEADPSPDARRRGRSAAAPVALTAERVANAQPPVKGERVITDAATPGLVLRIRASGAKSYAFVYRARGAGRAGTVRRVTIGDAARMTLKQARREAARLRDDVVDRIDPAAEKRAAAEAERARREAQERLDARLKLSEALDAYQAHLNLRGVKEAANVVSVLRRYLHGGCEGRGEPFEGLGDAAVADIDRASVMRLVGRLETAGLPGAAKSLRQKSATFLNWAADRGHIQANPLAGMRRERQTRAALLAAPGRMLTEEELGAVWRACADPTVNRAFASVVRILILTGQRRTETSLMRWEDLDLAAGWWTIPADVAKNGRAHEVPLPGAARALISAQPRFNACPWVFTNNGRAPVSGWSKLEPALRTAAALGAPWTLHDLRRSFRSGLTRIGAEDRLAELMINHRPRDLRAVYDREPRLEERRRLADRWAERLASFLEGRSPPPIGGNVVVLRATREGAR